MNLGGLRPIASPLAKRFAGTNHFNRPTKNRAGGQPPSRKATSAATSKCIVWFFSERRPASLNRFVTDQSLCASSSEDDGATNETDGPVSLNRIFRELKNTQVNIRENRTENQGIHQQVTKLTQKIAQFKALIASVQTYFLVKTKKALSFSFSTRKVTMILIVTVIRMTKKCTRKRSWVDRLPNHSDWWKNQVLSFYSFMMVVISWLSLQETQVTMPASCWEFSSSHTNYNQAYFHPNSRTVISSRSSTKNGLLFWMVSALSLFVDESFRICREKCGCIE